MKGKAPLQDEVVKEYPPVGKYRVRLLRAPKSKKLTLDVREYITSDTFDGFTRRGIRLECRAHTERLREVIGEVLAMEEFGEASLPPPKAGEAER